MVSRFINLFKKNDFDEQRAFQGRVLSILREIYPEKEFTADEDPLVINAGPDKLGLTNLRSNYLLSKQPDSTLRELIETHVGAIINSKDQLDADSANWETASDRLMPQLMPAELLEHSPLVHFPFGDDVVLAFVIDGDDAYRYVTEKNLQEWGIDKEELKETAVWNLAERSRGIAIQVFEGGGSIFVINTMDSFDAVRIILPSLRELIVEHLGSPFYFGIPNRDFLICWSQNSSDPDFHKNQCAQISSDFDQQPYPLSRFPFIVTETDEIKLSDGSEPDPQASSAHKN